MNEVLAALNILLGLWLAGAIVAVRNKEHELETERVDMQWRRIRG